ncbi:hypothetical protein FA15DRAFT_673290 [Coprinopsis marcescibilis]|uniref:Nephrocystin 3-like N-terminal domain-containing protein n=1 Tax=Coprinopsis marcescibilis TaxID=230819 RepID=A0A5C3KXJ2_COPMA|nr:hypothetical protein FA15DRAFT_673290 [Coprinopsis marcescibilis]
MDKWKWAIQEARRADLARRTLVTAFAGASNVNLQNVQINVVGGSVYNTTNGNSEDVSSEIKAAIQRLPNPEGCSWDVDEGCLPGTRQAHIEEIKTWVSNLSEGSAKIHVLADGAGSGKTALAHTICHHLHKQGHLVAGFFFSQKNAAQATTSGMMATLIRGLCAINGEVQHQIGEILLADTTLSTAPFSRQLDEIVLPVCKYLPTDRPLVIVLDSLDEGFDAKILKFLRNTVPALPSNFRIIVTTRPEPRIMDDLENKPHVQFSIHPLVGETTHGDVRALIETQFSEMSDFDSVAPELVDKFVAKTEGVFLWATTVLNHLKNSYDPVEELTEILGSKSHHWEASSDANQKLDDLYTHILSKLPWTDLRFAKMFRTVMGAVVTLQESLTPDALALLYKPDGVTLPGIMKLGGHISPLLRGFKPKDPSKPIRLLHWSIQEFITTRAPDGKPYRVDQAEHHTKLSQLALLTVQKDLNLDKVPTLGFLEHDRWVLADAMAFCLPRINSASAPEPLRYSCVFLDAHIRKALMDEPLLVLLRETLSVKSRELLEYTLSLGPAIDLPFLFDLAFANTSESLTRETQRSIALAMTSASDIISDDSRPSEAMGLSKTAVSIFRQILDKDDISTVVDLAKALLIYSIPSVSLKQTELAHELCQEAMNIVRKLETTDLKQYVTFIAAALGVVGGVMQESERSEEAIALTGEAVDLLRRLVEEGQSELEGDLVTWLMVYGVILVRNSRFEEGLKASHEAVSLFPRLNADEERGQFSLRSALLLQASAFESCGLREDAIETLQKMVEVARQAAARRPADNVYQLELAYPLRTLSRFLFKAGRYAESIPPAQESVDIVGRVVDIQPTEVANASYGASLHYLARNMAYFGDYDAAMPLFVKAIECFQKLDSEKPKEYELPLARSLHNYGCYLIKSGHGDKAVKHLQHSIDIYRRFIPIDPKKYEAKVAKFEQMVASANSTP